MSNYNFTRRQFLKTSSAALAAVSVPTWLRAAAVKPEDAFRGLKVGVASYSFRKFNLDQALAMTRQAGVKYITLKDFHLPYKTTTEQRKDARKKAEAAGVVLMGGGVIYMNNKEDEIRSFFDYAKDAGMPTIVCSPDPAALDTIEKYAKQYDIRIAIHNHGPGDKRYPSPLDVWRMVKDRDTRMGICMDVGHSVRIGEDPVAVMKECASRLYDFHIKDVTEATPKGKAIEVGKGVINTPAVLKVLVDMKFPYHVALEHELDADNPLPGVIASFDYMRREAAKI